MTVAARVCESHRAELSLAQRLTRRRELCLWMTLAPGAVEPPAVADAITTVAAQHDELGSVTHVRSLILRALETPSASELPSPVVRELAETMGVEPDYLLTPAVAEAKDRADVLAALDALGVAKTMRVCRDTSGQPALSLLILALGIAGGNHRPDPPGKC